MQYSPKLKKAMQEINKILEDNDIAGVIVLHTPLHSEYLAKLNPSYSCAKFEGGNLRIKALKSEYPTLEAWQEKVRATSNMFHMLSGSTAKLSLNLIEASTMLDKVTQADHFGGGHSSHIQQNN